MAPGRYTIHEVNARFESSLLVMRGSGGKGLRPTSLAGLRKLALVVWGDLRDTWRARAAAWAVLPADAEQVSVHLLAVANAALFLRQFFNICYKSNSFSVIFCFKNLVGSSWPRCEI